MTVRENITVDDLLSLSFPLLVAVDFMEIGRTFYKPSTQQACKTTCGILNSINYRIWTSILIL